MDLIVQFVESYKKAQEQVGGVLKEEEFHKTELERFQAGIKISEPVESKQPNSYKLCQYLSNIVEFVLDENLEKASTIGQEMHTIAQYYIQFGLSPFLPHYFQSGCRNVKVEATDLSQTHKSLLKRGIEFMDKVTASVTDILPKLNTVRVEMLAGMVTLAVEKESMEDALDRFKTSVSLPVFIHDLLLLKSSPNLPLNYAKWIHKQLIETLESPQGLQSLCHALMVNTRETDDNPQWKRCETIARIVSAKEHRISFHLAIIQQLEEIYGEAIQAEDPNNVNLSVCISCWNQLLGLKKDPITERIQKIFVAKLDILANPTDTLSGLIILDHDEVKQLINWNYFAFHAGSAMSSVESKLLAPYLVQIFQMARFFPSPSDERRRLERIFIQCLSNRKAAEVERLLEAILLSKQHQFKTIHPRIGIKRSAGIYSFVITSMEEQKEEEDREDKVDNGSQLVSMLKRSNNNILTFNVFLRLLHLFDAVMEESHDSQMATNDPLFMSTEEAQMSVTDKFRDRCVMTATLAELISYKPFHFQFADRGQEILDHLTKYFERRAAASVCESDEVIIMIKLSIIRELMLHQRDRYVDQFERLEKALNSVNNKCQHLPTIAGHIEYFLRATMKGGNEEDAVSGSQSEYDVARQHVSNKEPYLRVLGMSAFMKQIREKQPATMANLHPILLLALNCIRDTESYTFLNAIQLLTLLTQHLEETVIEALFAEYQGASNGTAEEAAVDYQLKIGEAIVKVVDCLGPTAIKYKQLLLSEFIKAIGSHAMDQDVRVSCLYNLGQICKSFCYQLHGCFYDLMGALQRILERDSYPPLRRAAALLLTNLITGITNLVDMQEQLLPIYRLLKFVAATDADERTRIHAGNGLDALKEKVTQSMTLLNNNKSGALEKEIKIMADTLDDIRFY